MLPYPKALKTEGDLESAGSYEAISVPAPSIESCPAE